MVTMTLFNSLKNIAAKVPYFDGTREDKIDWIVQQIMDDPYLLKELLRREAEKMLPKPNESCSHERDVEESIELAKPQGPTKEQVIERIIARGQVRAETFFSTFKMPDGRSLAEWTIGEIRRLGFRERTRASEAHDRAIFFRELAPGSHDSCLVRDAIKEEAADKLWKSIKNGTFGK